MVFGSMKCSTTFMITWAVHSLGTSETLRLGSQSDFQGWLAATRLLAFATLSWTLNSTLPSPLVQTRPIYTVHQICGSRRGRTTSPSSGIVSFMAANICCLGSMPTLPAASYEQGLHVTVFRVLLIFSCLWGAQAPASE